jgi:hypothetical protein
MYAASPNHVWTGSWNIAAGRAAGGATYGAVASALVLYAGQDPWKAGAAGGEAGYTADMLTQKGLSAMGVQGRTEDPSIPDFVTSTAVGGVTGYFSPKLLPPLAVTNIEIPPGQYLENQVAKNVIGKTGNIGELGGKHRYPDPIPAVNPIRIRIKIRIRANRFDIRIFYHRFIINANDVQEKWFDLHQILSKDEYRHYIQYEEANSSQKGSH